MATTLTPTLTPEQTAWLALHGPIEVSVAGCPATLDANGVLTVRPCAADVECDSEVAALDDDEAARVEASVGGWIDGWIAQDR